MTNSQTAFGTSVITVIVGLSLALCSTPPALAQDIGSTVIFADNSVWVKQNADVLSGDVVVNDDSPGPTLASQKELTFGLGTTSPAGFAVKAHAIKVKSSGEVNGTVSCNDLDDNSGTVNGGSGCIAPLDLPVFDPSGLPLCETRSPEPGVQDVFVGIGGSAVLPPGGYGDITVKKNGIVTFTGGEYIVRSIDAGISADLLFAGPAEVFVEDKFDTDKNAIVGPSAGATIGASDIIFYVGGINGNNGNLGATPKAAQLGLSNTVNANFCVPNGTLLVRQNTNATGSFRAKDVILGIKANATLDSFFANKPPAADAQSIFSDGSPANSVKVTLSGNDPEGGDLIFTIEVLPTLGYAHR